MRLEASVAVAKAWREWKPSRERTAFTWGLPWLEASLPSPLPGSLTIIGGRPGAGKSFFTLELLSRSARAMGRPCVYASLEEPRLEVGRRLAGLEHEQLLIACPDSSRLTPVLELVDEAGRLGAGWVAIDYVQLLDNDTDYKPWGRGDAVSYSAKALKGAAKRAGVPLLLVSSLKRPADGQGAHMPSLYDLKETGDLEYSAEVVIMLAGRQESCKAEVLKAKSARAGSSQRYQRSSNGRLLEETESKDV